MKTFLGLAFSYRWSQIWNETAMEGGRNKLPQDFLWRGSKIYPKSMKHHTKSINKIIGTLTKSNFGPHKGPRGGGSPPGEHFWAFITSPRHGAKNPVQETTRNSITPL